MSFPWDVISVFTFMYVFVAILGAGFILYIMVRLLRYFFIYHVHYGLPVLVLAGSDKQAEDFAGQHRIKSFRILYSSSRIVGAKRSVLYLVGSDWQSRYNSVSLISAARRRGHIVREVPYDAR